MRTLHVLALTLVIVLLKDVGSTRFRSSRIFQRRTASEDITRRQLKENIFNRNSTSLKSKKGLSAKSAPSRTPSSNATSPAPTTVPSNSLPTTPPRPTTLSPTSLLSSKAKGSKKISSKVGSKALTPKSKTTSKASKSPVVSELPTQSPQLQPATQPVSKVSPSPAIPTTSAPSTKSKASKTSSSTVSSKTFISKSKTTNKASKAPVGAGLPTQSPQGQPTAQPVPKASSPPVIPTISAPSSKSKGVKKSSSKVSSKALKSKKKDLPPESNAKSKASKAPVGVGLPKQTPGIQPASQPVPSVSSSPVNPTSPVTLAPQTILPPATTPPAPTTNVPNPTTSSPTPITPTTTTLTPAAPTVGTSGPSPGSSITLPPATSGPVATVTAVPSPHSSPQGPTAVTTSQPSPASSTTVTTNAPTPSSSSLGPPSGTSAPNSATSPTTATISPSSASSGTTPPVPLIPIPPSASVPPQTGQPSLPPISGTLVSATAFGVTYTVTSTTAPTPEEYAAAANVTLSHIDGCLRTQYQTSPTASFVRVEGTSVGTANNPIRIGFSVAVLFAAGSSSPPSTTELDTVIAACFADPEEGILVSRLTSEIAPENPFSTTTTATYSTGSVTPTTVQTLRTEVPELSADASFVAVPVTPFVVTVAGAQPQLDDMTTFRQLAVLFIQDCLAIVFHLNVTSGLVYASGSIVSPVRIKLDGSVMFETPLATHVPTTKQVDTAILRCFNEPSMSTVFLDTLQQLPPSNGFANSTDVSCATATAILMQGPFTPPAKSLSPAAIAGIVTAGLVYILAHVACAYYICYQRNDRALVHKPGPSTISNYFGWVRRLRTWLIKTPTNRDRAMSRDDHAPLALIRMPSHSTPSPEENLMYFMDKDALQNG